MIKITLEDNNYPEQLRKIDNPPKQLYLKGNIKLLDVPGIAIIGSRECTKYGEKMAKKFSKELSLYGLTIISGMAKGIDSFAHIGCIEGAGNTIAVLPSGLNNIYPQENKKLFKDILDFKVGDIYNLEDIKKKHGVDPVTQAETAGIINSSIRASRSNLETLQRKLDVSKQTLSNYRSELRIAERELEKLGAKDTTVAKVPETEWKHISTFLEDICKRVQESARKDLLHKIEERANLFYAKFTEHDNGYKGNVKIGEDYSIEFDAGLNTSHEDRKKMSIINALLSLNQEAMGIYYPFISDAPTSSFDLETTHKYLLGIKDIFGQSIVLTKDVDLESDKYLDLQNQSNVSRIYNLESKIYSGDSNRGQHEVSTQITILK